MLFLFLRRLTSVVYLMTHPAVPLRLKILPILALAYLVVPRDVIPDFIRFFGLLDDLIVMSVLLGIFTSKGFRYVQAEKKANKDAVPVEFEVIDRVESNGPRPGTDGNPPTSDLRS